MNDLLEGFFQECDDLLEGLTAGLNDLENGASDAETINAMFRAVHSIKGGAGAFGLTQMIGFAHTFENVLDAIRGGKLTPDDSVTGLMFAASDTLTDMVEAARKEEQLPAEAVSSILSDLKLLDQNVNGSSTDASDDEEVAFEPLTLDLGDMLGGLPDIPDASGIDTGAAVTIRFAAKAHLFETGNDPVLLFRALEKLGDLTVSADISAIPSLQAYDWRQPVMTWKLHLIPDDGIDEAAIREVFEFVEGDCEIDLTIDPAPGATTATPDSAPGDDIAEPPQPEPDAAAPAPDQATTDAEPPQPAEAAAKPAVARTATIRVDLQRVDRLINLVGELVICEAMLRQSLSEVPELSHPAIETAKSQLKQISGMLQASVMAIRAQPVRNLFQRMSRIARESAREAGKTARLVTVGDATEVDKTVVERLADPLTHMIRNAVDHGLESAETRLAAGKPERGTVTLAAEHRSGRVVITLSDDGAGINRRKVRQIAEDKGLIRPEDELTDADIENLLFRPGFSTSSEISNLSGRGVGMDVVRSEIQALGGRVSLHSTPGEGTTVTISLPLTLAVLEGMIVKVEGEVMVVPTLALRETLQSEQAGVHNLGDGDRVLLHDDMLVPIVDLGTGLGLRQAPLATEPHSLLLIEGDSGKLVALSVDEVIEQREVVIKGLETNYQQVPGIAAATILGDGNIALIVDTDQMFHCRIAAPTTPAALPPAGSQHGDPHYV